MKVLLIVLAVLGVAAVSYYAYYQSKSPSTEMMYDTQPTQVPAMMESVTLDLATQNNSGESGTATLTEKEGQIVVTLSMMGFTPGVSQPAHIHVGNCPEVGAVKYPLSNVLDGTSMTTLNLTLAQLKSELPLGINVHKSASEAKVYTACGDVKL